MLWGPASPSGGHTALRVGLCLLFPTSTLCVPHLGGFLLSAGMLIFLLLPVLSHFPLCLLGELLLVIPYPTQMSLLYETFPGLS